MEDTNPPACKCSLKKSKLDCATGSSKSCSNTTVTASFDDLPSEIILNILSRVPVKSVLRCRCVSKTWCNMIDDPSLINMHMHNSAAVEKHDIVYVALSYYKGRSCPGWQYKTRLFLLKDEGNILRRSEYPIAEFVDAHEYDVSAINLGILIFVNKYKKGHSFLLNPRRGEVLMLPPATVLASPRRTVPEHFGFGFDSTTNVYKVVHVSTLDIMQDPLDYVAEVYTLGTKSWLKISSVFPYCVDSMPISACGDIHWMISDANSKGSAESMIISFDFKREEFKLTPHPEFRCKEYNYFHLVELRGSLAIVDLSPITHIEIWVLKDYDKKEWAQEYRLSMELWRRELRELWRREQLPHFEMSRFQPGNFGVVGAWEDGLLFKVGMENKFFYFNQRTDSLRYISRISPSAAARNKPDFLDQFNSWIYSYRGSLVSLRNHGNLMVKDERTGNCFDLAAAGVDSAMHSVKI